MKIVLKSAGKAGVLGGQVPADLYIDCRGMVNPYRDPVLGGLDGDSEVLQDWIRQHNKMYLEACFNQVRVAELTASSRNSFKSAPQKPLTVCFFCLAGVHRSRGMKNVVAAELKQAGYEVEVI